MVNVVTEESLPWPLIFAAMIAVPEAISLCAFFLQRSRIGSKLPEALENIYEPQEYDTSNRYTKAKSNLKLVKDFVDLVWFFGFWFMHGFPWLDSICVSFGFGTIVTGLVFFGLFGLISFVIDLPFEIYGTFVLEEEFGFNRTTPCTFIKDRVKGMTLALVLGVPILCIIQWYFLKFGSYAWLYVFLTVTTIQVILLFLMPVLILPLFMEMIPLPEGSAFVSEEIEKAGSGSFLSCRVFYKAEGALEAWTTKDRRFQGDGATLSIHFKDNNWVLSEGEPSTAGKVYATTKASLELGVTPTSWKLTADGKIALKVKEGEENALLSKDTISVTQHDVGRLKKRLLDLANQVGYLGANIFVIDGSSRSSHSNAFCTGFGKFRRICLYDTLLPTMTEDEIVAILGHEMGHDRLYHVHTTLAITIAYLALQLFCLGQFIGSPIIAGAFFVPEPKVYLGLVLFSIVWGIVDFFFSIPLTVKTRFNEYQADQYSIDADESHAFCLGNGLKKLCKKSKANLTPHPFYVFLTYSHPPLDIRLAAIDAYAKSKKK